jgi:RNA polymerase sigma factor (TIGR02999 family)
MPERESADTPLSERFYTELHGIAERLFAKERGDHTLQPTALVNEACVRLLSTSRLGDLPREQKLALAARVLKQVLIDHARTKGAGKRGAGHVRIELDPELRSETVTCVDFDRVHAALERLSTLHARQAEVVTLRVFGGLQHGSGGARRGHEQAHGRGRLGRGACVAEARARIVNAPDFHARASALFLELRELSRDAARVAGAHAGEDSQLAEEVRSLLEHDEPDAPDDCPSTSVPIASSDGWGSGASGQVFLAEQLVPVRRKVALKVPLAAFHPELAARFEVERAALEATDHPCITRVLDAGRTPEGLPYLVMNFVEGEPLTDYCARKALDFEERVRLFLDVAGAVEHAHQRGVIHRDLKPANVLVSEVDGEPVPQVLDFGIAKTVPGAFRGDTPLTLGTPMGTPAYMAPEQTRQGPVDTRADVYAMGAILYELVTGQPPLAVDDDPLVFIERLREHLPQPASRVRAQGSPTAAAGLLARTQQADLDRILGKALEKEPGRRYPSAAAFSEDLRRLLASEPISARAASFGYRAKLFVRRNRVLVAAGSIATLALLGGVVGLWSGLHEARMQMARAADQFDAAVRDQPLPDRRLACGRRARGRRARPLGARAIGSRQRQDRTAARQPASRFGGDPPRARGGLRTARRISRLRKST